MAESTALLKRRLGIPRTQGSNPCLSASSVEKAPVFSTDFLFFASSEAGVLTFLTTSSKGNSKGNSRRVFGTCSGKPVGSASGDSPHRLLMAAYVLCVSFQFVTFNSDAAPGGITDEVRMKIKKFFLILSFVTVSIIALLYGISPGWFA